MRKSLLILGVSGLLAISSSVMAQTSSTSTSTSNSTDSTYGSGSNGNNSTNGTAGTTAPADPYQYSTSSTPSSSSNYNKLPPQADTKNSFISARPSTGLSIGTSRLSMMKHHKKSSNPDDYSNDPMIGRDTTLSNGGMNSYKDNPSPVGSSRPY